MIPLATSPYSFFAAGTLLSFHTYRNAYIASGDHGYPPISYTDADGTMLPVKHVYGQEAFGIGELMSNGAPLV